MSWPFRSWGQALMAHEEVVMQPVAIVFALADVPQGAGTKLSIWCWRVSYPCVGCYTGRPSTSLTIL